MKTRLLNFNFKSILIPIIGILTTSLSSNAQITISTVAGSGGYLDGPVSEVQVNPRVVAVNKITGDVYFSDRTSTIRKFDAIKNIVETIAGSKQLKNSTNGVGSIARFNNIVGLCLNAANDSLFIADENLVNSKVRVLNLTTNIVSDLITSPFRYIRGLTIAGRNLFIVHEDNKDFNYVKRIELKPGFPVTSFDSVSGFISSSTIPIGTLSNTKSFVNCAVFKANAIASNGIDKLYVLSARHTVVEINLNTKSSSVIGGVTANNGAYAEGALGTSKFSFTNTSGVVFKQSDNSLYITDNNRVRKIDLTTIITSTISGSSSGFGNGAGTNAKFRAPSGIDLDANGDFVVADVDNSTLRKVEANGTTSIIFGDIASAINNIDPSKAVFNGARSMVKDNNGNTYLSNTRAHVITKISPTGVVTTLSGIIGSSNVTRFSNPSGLTLIGDSLYVADEANSRIKSVNINNGISNSAILVGYKPINVVKDGDSILYVMGENRLSKLNLATKTISIFAGKSIAGYKNGIDTAVRFKGLNGGAIYRDTLFLSDGTGDGNGTTNFGGVRFVVIRGVNKGTVGTYLTNNIVSNPSIANTVKFDMDKPGTLAIDADGIMYVPSIKSKGILRFNIKNRSLVSPTSIFRNGTENDGVDGTGRVSVDANAYIDNNTNDLFLTDYDLNANSSGFSRIRKITGLNNNKNTAPSFARTRTADTSYISTNPVQKSIQVLGSITANQSAFEPVQNQTVSFEVTTPNTNLFSVQPAINSTGLLTYTIAANQSGTATLTIKAKDNGGIANSGVDSSATQTYTVRIFTLTNVKTVTAEAKQSISIYPNPTQGLLNVSVTNPELKKVSVSVSNIIGNIVYTNVLGSSEIENTEINLNGVSAGLYFVKTTIGSKTEVKKVTVK